MPRSTSSGVSCRDGFHNALTCSGISFWSVQDLDDRVEQCLRVSTLVKVIVSNSALEVEEHPAPLVLCLFQCMKKDVRVTCRDEQTRDTASEEPIGFRRLFDADHCSNLGPASLEVLGQINGENLWSARVPLD